MAKPLFYLWSDNYSIPVTYTSQEYFLAALDQWDPLMRKYGIEEQAENPNIWAWCVVPQNEFAAVKRKVEQGGYQAMVTNRTYSEQFSHVALK